MIRYILISNVSEPDIDGVKKEIEKKKKIVLNMIRQQPDFGFIFSTDCDETKYKTILNLNNKKVRSSKPIIISFPENFDDIYKIINTNFLSEHCFDYCSKKILDLSNLEKKANITVDFNSDSFAQTLYYLCYKFQSEQTFINELNLDNNRINYDGFDHFSSLQNLFFPYLKKLFIRKNDFSLDEVNLLLSKDIQYIYYQDYAILLSRQTDLTCMAIEKFIDDHNLQDNNMPFIANEIHKFENTFQPSDYNSNEAYQLHQLKFE